MKNKFGWEVKKFSEVVYFQEGPGVRNWQFTETGIKLINIRNIVDNQINLSNTFNHLSIEEVENKYKHFLCNEGDYVMASSGVTWGKIAIIKKEHLPLCLNTSIIRLVPLNIDTLHKRFLYHFITSDGFRAQIKKLITGSAQPNFGPSHLKKVLLPVPPLPTQHQIVSELDALSEIISKKKQQLEELDKLAQATFYDMFGDPVTNEKGWEKGKIADIVTSVNYGTSSPSTIDGRYKYLRMNNLTYNGQIDLTDLKYIDIETRNYEKYVVRKGDILFNRTNSKELVGKTICFLEDEEMIIAGYLIRVRVNDLFNPIFVSYYMNTHFIKAYLKNLCKNIIGMANINAKELQSIPIYFPPLEIQNQFATKIESIESQKSLITQSIAEVQQLFDSTMDRYFG